MIMPRWIAGLLALISLICAILLAVELYIYAS